MKGNVVDMAIGVIVGAAFGKIVSSLVGDVITPIIGKAIGGVNFTDLAVSLGADPKGVPVLVRYGAFIQTVFDFLIIAVVIFNRAASRSALLSNRSRYRSWAAVTAAESAH